MPAISVARTDTFENQRQKINQISDQIFAIAQGGSDLSTGILKLGDGTKLTPSLAFTKMMPTQDSTDLGQKQLVLFQIPNFLLHLIIKLMNFLMM